MSEVVARSPHEILQFALDLQDRHPGMEVWFRGQIDQDWPIQTTLDRAPSLRKWEEELLNDFYAKSPPFMSGPVSRFDYTQRLTIARHYGLPCRLLDWTESVVTAVFHAIGLEDGVAAHQGAEGLDAKIFALIPRYLNTAWEAIEEHEIDGKLFRRDHINGPPGSPASLIRSDEEPIPLIHHGHERVGRIVADAFEQRKKRDRRILGVMAPIADPRMASQQAAFTIHGTSTPLDRLYRSAVVKPGPAWLHSIVVPNEVFSDVRKFIEATGIRESRVFPDLEHLAVEVRRMLVKRRLASAPDEFVASTTKSQ